ncbi:MFS transporter [Klebsiella michiganensis]|uniref:MFS transporter n=1 Tax=Klebsiella michiganensis TaxID=1134687 RepID=UPI00190DA77B|nr:MFS transporter [Klebsiella michiganensis]QQO68325.1 MFS transporter [Klebsiella michiganensis]
MNISTLNPAEKKNFISFFLFFFFYYFIMSAYFPFFPVWLADVNHLSKTETGIVFSCVAFFGIIFQFLFGYITDKLGLRKHLLWVIIWGLVFFAPFFLLVFKPLLANNIYIGSVVGGLYLGFVFSGGSGAIDAYIEKVSRANNFEYGKVRMSGCIGWAVCASLTGMLMGINPDIIFWISSGFALILAVILLIARPEPQSTQQGIEAKGKKADISIPIALSLFKLPSFWAFLIYVLGVASIYDVFDQQFANFFKSFFESPQRGNQIFGFVTTGGELLNACIMFIAPFVVLKVGAKKVLLLAGTIMTLRILGSSIATTPVEVVLLKMLHMFEMPFLYIGTFKYINKVFDPRLSATIYLVGFNVAKHVSAIFLSSYVGQMYDKMGFHQAYVFLGCITLTFTVISFFLLRNTPPEEKKAMTNSVVNNF